MWLRIKIMAALAALIALPLVAAFVTLGFAGHLVLQGSANNDLNAETAATAQSIEDKLALAFADLKAWAAMPVMQDVLIGDNGGEIKRVIGDLRRIYPEIAEITVTDGRGLVVAASDGVKTQDLASDEGFRTATTGRSYQTTAPGRTLSTSPTLSFTVPVLANYDRQSVVGTVTGTLDLKALIKSAVATSRLSGKGRSLIVEQGGITIYGSRMTAGLTQALRGIGDYRARGVHDVSWNDQSYIAASVPTTGARLLSDPKLVIIGIVPTANAFVAVDRLSTIVGAAVVLALLVAAFYAWRWTTPLVQVARAMERVSHGDTAAKLPDIAWEQTFGPMARALDSFRQTRVVRDKLAAREKELERAKDAAETALHAKSEHLASLSRALKAELSTIVELADSINREALKEAASGKGNLQRMNDLKDISRSGVQLLGIINDLFDLSEAEAGHASLDEAEVDLGEIVHECVGLMREAADKGRIDLVCQPPDDGVIARVDVYKIKQIMFNLLSNAVKFTPEGGTVNAAVRIGADGNPTITVSDTGIGMPAHLSPMAFSSAHDNEHGRHGAGLGLPLAKQLVELHGGTVEIESEAGKGTSVIVKLPASRIVVREDEAVAEAAAEAPVEGAAADVAAVESAIDAATVEGASEVAAVEGTAIETAEPTKADEAAA